MQYLLLALLLKRDTCFQDLGNNNNNEIRDGIGGPDGRLKIPAVWRTPPGRIALRLVLASVCTPG